MIQKLDKYGNTSIDNGKVIVVDKYGVVKQPSSGGGGSPTGPAGGDLSGTYPNPSVVWTNGESTYNSVYFAIPTGTTSQYIRGDGSLAPFPSGLNPTLQDVTDNGNETTNPIYTAGFIFKASGVEYIGIGNPALNRYGLYTADGNKNIADIDLTSPSSAVYRYAEDKLVVTDTTFTYEGVQVATLNDIPTVGTWGALNYPTWTTGTPFVKMTAAGTFALDDNTYLTSISGISAGGDLQGTYPNPTVHQIQGQSVQNGNPANQDLLIWDNTANMWKHQQISTITGYNKSNWDNAYNNRISSLTTTGSSGSATLISNILNIPTYTLAGLGGISLTSLSSTATGLTYNNTTGVFSLTTGYLIPTTSSYNNTNWDTAYTDRYKWDGGATGLVAATGRTSLGLGTFAVANYPVWSSGTPFVKMTAAGTFALDTSTYLTTAVTSVSGTGTVAGLTLSGTVTSTGNITLGGTLSTPVSTINDSTTVGQNFVKLTNPSAITFIRVNADNTISTLDASTFRTAIGAGTSSTNGTVTSVSALTLGTSGTDLSSSVANGTTTPVITLNVPTASASNRGALSSTDWTTFNNKQNALSFTPYKFIQNSQTPVTGSVSETIVATATIAGNTFSTSDIMKISFIVTKTASTANMTLRMKINTSNTLSGATTIATFTFAASSLFAKFGRYFNLFGGNLYGYNFLSSAVDDSVTIATAGSSTAYNTANTLYFFFTVQLGNSGDTVTPNSCNITN